MSFLKSSKTNKCNLKCSKEKFTEMINEIENDLYNVAKVKLKIEDDISDAIQEAIIKIFEHLDELKDKKSFKPWAIKILLNVCNKIHKEKYKNIELLNKITENKLPETLDYTIDKIEDTLCFEEIISDLPSIEQDIFIYYYMYQYPTKDIAEYLKINENTIKSKMCRGKQKIKEKFLKGGYDCNEK